MSDGLRRRPVSLSLAGILVVVLAVALATPLAGVAVADGPTAAVEPRVDHGSSTVIGSAPVEATDVRTGGEIVIGSDETIDGDLTVMGGSVTVDGTVDGDLSAIVGDVLVTGTVTGDVEVFSGAIRIEGDVAGDVSVGAGAIEHEGTIDGTFAGASGAAELDGTIDEDASIAAGAVTLGPSATIGGDLSYVAGAVDIDPAATVDGSVTQVEPVEPVEPPGAIVTVLSFLYSLLVNLAFGAILLLLLPEFSRRTTVRSLDETARSAGVGLLVLFVVPVVLVLFLITILGIPIALVGGAFYLLAIWAGYVYGAIAVGTWLLGRAGSTAGRWAALVVGILLISIVGAIPLIGWLIALIVTLVGLGALSLGLVRGSRARRDRRVEGWPRDAAGRIGDRRRTEPTADSPTPDPLDEGTNGRGDEPRDRTAHEPDEYDRSVGSDDDRPLVEDDTDRGPPDERRGRDGRGNDSAARDDPDRRDSEP